NRQTGAGFVGTHAPRGARITVERVRRAVGAHGIVGRADLRADLFDDGARRIVRAREGLEPEVVVVVRRALSGAFGVAGRVAAAPSRGGSAWRRRTPAAPSDPSRAAS